MSTTDELIRLQREIDRLADRLRTVENVTGKIPLYTAGGGGGGGDAIVHAANYTALAAITNRAIGTRGVTDDNDLLYIYRADPGVNSGNPKWRIAAAFCQDTAPSGLGESKGDFWHESDTTRIWFHTGTAWEYQVRHHTSLSASNKKEGDLVTVSSKGYQCVDTGNTPPGTTHYDT